jgi:hypothetical protein
MNTNEGRRAFTSEPPVDLVFCGLTWAAGGLEPCPGEACTFWSNDHCVLAWLREDELAGAPEFTSLLLGVRRQFERSGSAPSRPAS